MTSTLPPPELLPSTQADSFVIKVGERIRRIRQHQGISRRALSEQTGISQRYLAQLDEGKGNISIRLLFKLCQALDCTMESLLRDADSDDDETAQMAALYRRATPAQREKIRAILLDDSRRQSRGGKIAFIGLRGAGKSTLGRLSAERLGLPFVELNQHIEQLSGMAVGEIMALYGPEGYRRLEKQAMEQITGFDHDLILAVAGGVVGNPETYAYLLHHCRTIWLMASPEEHMARVRAQGDRRPMAGSTDAMEELQLILTSRQALYARAEAAVNTSGTTVDESLAAVIAVIAQKKFLRV